MMERGRSGGGDPITTATAVDRFEAALYSQAEAAAYLGLPASTFRSWSRGYRARRPQGEVVGRPVITAFEPRQRGDAAVPFVGLAEGYALAAIRRSGVPLQRIRPALERLSAELGVAHALASKRLFTDGAEVLFDYSLHVPDDEAKSVRELVVVRNGQRVLNEAVGNYLQRIAFAPDGYAEAFPLPGFSQAEVIVDARRSFGQPRFARGGGRLEDALSLFRAGESMAVVSDEFGVPLEQLEDAIRHAFKASA
jgi:uncharacterized protein (DUF433 family)